MLYAQTDVLAFRAGKDLFKIMSMLTVRKKHDGRGKANSTTVSRPECSGQGIDTQSI